MQPESAPKPGCDCAVCQWANLPIAQRTMSPGARVAQDEDLAANYARYEAGLLVSREDED